MDNVLILELIGIPVIFLGGSLFHFLYKYGGKKLWMSIISPVNESIWEHLKIAFYPALLYAGIQAYFWQDRPQNYFTAELIGIFSMMAFILVIELIYPAILKKNILVLDLLVFFISISLSQIISYALFQNEYVKLPDIAIVLIILLQVGIFTLFNFKTPRIGLFRSSIGRRKYGIK